MFVYSCVHVCVCVRALGSLNLNVKELVYLHVHLPKEHCSFTQCTPLTFQLHLSAQNKGLPARL